MAVRTNTVAKSLKNNEQVRCLLIFGDDLRVTEKVKSLISSLVPADQQVLNVDRIDGRITPWERVRASLMTPPFFPGTKVVWIEDAPYFMTGDQRNELGEKVMQLWNEGKEQDAAKLLADVLVLEGWTQERWEAPAPGATREIAALVNSDDENAVERLMEYCRRQPLDLGRRRSAQLHGLEDLLEQGVPAWAFLLMTATQVDRRMRLYKRLEQMSAVLYLGLERERYGKVSRDALQAFITDRLLAAAKTADAQARESIIQRAPADLRKLGNELDKLFLYVGERSSLRAHDVDAIVTDYGEDWVFELTNAISDQNACAALANLNRLMACGRHPLLLLGALASEARRLIAARELLDGVLRDRWKRGMLYPQFQQQVARGGLPSGMRGSYGEYMCFTRAQRFTMPDLRRYLSAIHDADARLKSTGTNPRLVLEELIFSVSIRDERAHP
jgi:DNA polymerase-3 subunit delta